MNDIDNLCKWMGWYFDHEGDWVQRKGSPTIMVNSSIVGRENSLTATAAIAVLEKGLSIEDDEHAGFYGLMEEWFVEYPHEDDRSFCQAVLDTALEIKPWSNHE